MGCANKAKSELSFPIIHHHFKTIGSTNTWCKEHVPAFESHALTLVTADEQTAGRGRFKRTWHSPQGGNIYATFCFFMPLERIDSGHIPQLLALAAALVLERLHFKPALKWPNDVLLSGKKVAGILSETVVQGGKRCVICGIGLNVNMTQEELHKIDRPATSLYAESAQEWEVRQILRLVAWQFRQQIIYFLREDFSIFFTDYRARSFLRPGQPIQFHDNQNIVKGAFHALNPDGSVTLKLAQGNLKTYFAGEFC